MHNEDIAEILPNIIQQYVFNYKILKIFFKNVYRNNAGSIATVASTAKTLLSLLWARGCVILRRTELLNNKKKNKLINMNDFWNDGHKRQ